MMDDVDKITAKDIANLESELVKNLDKLCPDGKVVRRLSRMIAGKLRPIRSILAAKELMERTR
jgi:hypothetical protein